MGRRVGRTAPRVSVIVPVRDRRDLLGPCLDSLAEQTLADHEVIVVDDGSTDGSGEAARARSAADPRLRVLDGGGAGAVAARVLGVKAARSDVLAFTDSDCQPAPDWLERGVARIDRGADVVEGRTEPTRPVRPLERTVWVTQDDGLFATCNVLYRRSAFDAAGGFDEDDGPRVGFRPGRRLRDLGFGEDTLLGWRVRRQGHSEFASDVLVRHHVFEVDVRSHLLRATNAGGFAVLVREVPELRTVFLRHQILLGPPTRLPLYAAAGLALTGRGRASAAATLVWMAAHANTLRRSAGSPRRRVAALPVVLAGDLVTAASLLAGSVRSRTIVL
jgi:glycosyltransferase involved in cell wall biosynthesis